jgi:hypothetical protein
MIRMIRSTLAFLSATALLSLAMERDASACGGCFHPPTQNVSDITDERMLLAVSPTQTSLYDQIRYSGNPASFAWVLPIHGTVNVALSADVLFDSIDALTTTQITAPESSCVGPPASCSTNAGFSGSPSPAEGAGGGVAVIKQQNVGPYATVQLKATDPGALNNWLAQNGYQIPSDVTPVVDAYVKEGFDFLAMKLLPGQGIQAMRPVRVTMPGASVSLPLRMAAVGTGPSVGITIWIVSDGRYEPQNFPFFHIDDKELVWDWSTSSSNYTTLRAQHEAALAGKGWELESSITLNTQLIANVVESGGQYYGGAGGGGGYPTAPPSDATEDYLAVPPDDAGSPGQTADQVRSADVQALYQGMTGANVRITRIRSDISHSAMTTDFLLQASADQSEVSNVRVVTQSVNEQCPVYFGCQVVGTAPVGPVTNGSGNGGAKSSTFSCEASPNKSRLGATLGASSFAMIAVVAARALRRRRRAEKR